MAKRRKNLSLKTKLASALCQMLRPDESGKLIPVIPYEDSKMMTEDQVLSLFQFDHGILHVNDGPVEHWNLTPRFIPEHRKKTAEIDIPAAAKSRRLERANARHLAALDSKTTGEPVIDKKKKKWGSRPFPKGRGFQKRGGR